jgi:hypothetical protein
MLTATQQHAVDQFAKSLSALGDDALIDTYHQAWEDQKRSQRRGRRQSQQGLRKESRDRKGNAGSLP